MIRRAQREIWEFIPGYEGVYEVSTHGRVRRLSGYNCTETRLLNPFVNGRYEYVALCIEGKPKFYPIHRLVLETFVGPKPKGHDPDHINQSKLDNRLSNLRWLPIYLNRGRKGENNGSSKLKKGEVWLIKKLLHHGVKVNNYMNKMFKVHPCTIKRIKSGKRWNHVKYE